MAYGKIFESLYGGSMVGSGPTVFAVWGYCIAMAKPPGYVELNPRIIGAAIGCPPKDVEAAIEVLEKPDPYSRSPDEDGRRLVKEGNFLYRMVTWGKYDGIRKEEERREQNRQAQARFRAKSNQPSATVISGKQNKPTETETETENRDGAHG
jgi:hypothetical protein